MAALTASGVNRYLPMPSMKINGRKTPVMGPGKTSRLIVTFKKKGKYTYLCTVDSHASLGMKGTFTVR